MTNLERVRTMDSDTLAHKLVKSPCQFCIYTHTDKECLDAVCVEAVKAWLEQEVDE